MLDNATISIYVFFTGLYQRQVLPIKIDKSSIHRLPRWRKNSLVKIHSENSLVVFQKLKKNILILRNASSVGEFIAYRRGSDSRINLKKEYCSVTSQFSLILFNNLCCSYHCKNVEDCKSYLSPIEVDRNLSTGSGH